MAKSTKAIPKRKPRKPYPDFPLFIHRNGQWCKKIRQKLHYFGKVADDPEGKNALERLNREWSYLKDGRTPPTEDMGDGCTMKTLCNAFLPSGSSKPITPITRRRINLSIITVLLVGLLGSVAQMLMLLLFDIGGMAGYLLVGVLATLWIGFGFATNRILDEE